MTGTYISAVSSYDRNSVLVYERTEAGRVTKTFPAPYYFFIQDDNGTYEDLYGVKLKKISFPDYETFHTAVKNYRSSGIQMWESDISPEYRVLSDKYYGQLVNDLNILFFDIEIDYDKTRGFDGAKDPYAEISAISYYDTATKKMSLDAKPPKGYKDFDSIPNDIDGCEVNIYKSEAEILLRFLERIKDADIISGWNSEGFDVPYIYERLKIVLGEKFANKLSFDGARKPYYKEVMDKNGLPTNVLKISGRVHLDFMNIFFKFDPGGRDSFALDSVAEDVLGIKKLHYEGSLYDLYHTKFVNFLKYNARDSELLKLLEEARGYIRLAVLLSHMDTGQIDDVNGTVKLTESAIINYCHHVLNKRVPDTKYDVDPNLGKFAGAFVLPAKPGLHEWVASIDVNSLYPSAMRTVNISPDTIVGQFTRNEQDYALIQSLSSEKISLRLENSQFITKPACEWGEWFLNNKYSVSGYGTVFNQSKTGVIPTLLASWFQDRKKYKKLMAESLKNAESANDDVERIKFEKLADYYDKLQNAFKLKLNSTYGACGNKYFKFYDVRLAESTTRTGREVLFHMARSIGEILCGNYMYPNDSVIYGDTDSCYFSTMTGDFEDACKIADFIESYINKSFNKFSKEKFFVQDNFLNVFAVSQETVANRAIFIDGKKNYMMRVLKKDGKLVDQIKITGLAIKKTTLPKQIRTVLIDAFSKFLRGSDWEDVGMYLLESSEKVRDEWDVMEIGLPKRVKNFETYFQNYEADSQCTLPGHVAAAIFWNKCLENYNDKESFKVQSGMRISVYYFKKPIGRFKAIAIPVDLNVLPEWFKANIEPLICRKTQSEKLIFKPIASILQAIDKIVPTRQRLLINEAFEF